MVSATLSVVFIIAGAMKDSGVMIVPTRIAPVIAKAMVTAPTRKKVDLSVSVILDIAVLIALLPAIMLKNLLLARLIALVMVPVLVGNVSVYRVTLVKIVRPFARMNVVVATVGCVRLMAPAPVGLDTKGLRASRETVVMKIAVLATVSVLTVCVTVTNLGVVVLVKTIPLVTSMVSGMILPDPAPVVIATVDPSAIYP
jgi:hypothetical protein